MIKEDNDALNGDGDHGADADKREGAESPTKVQDLTKAGREGFDPNEGQE